MRFADLPRTAIAYILSICALGVLVAVWSTSAWWSASMQPVGDVSPTMLPVRWSWWTYAALVLGTSAAHIFPVSSVDRRQAYHVSLPFFIAGIALLEPAPLFALLLVVHLAEWARRPQRSWFAQAFNLTTYILCTGAAQAVYRAIWPPAMQTGVDLGSLECLLAGGAAMVTFGFLNRALVSIVVWLGNGIPPAHQQMFERETLFIDACLLAMGLPLARLGLDAPWALLLGAAPVLLIHRALDLPNIRAQGRRDPLTRLSSVAAFKEACTRELSRARHFGRPLALVLVQIEHFDQIVADLGRQAGDVLLRDAALLLEQSARAYDVPARVGTAEFAVLLPETDATGARAMSDHVRRTLTERGFDIASSIEQVRVEVRTGMATVHSEPVSVEELFAAASAALTQSTERRSSDASSRLSASAPARGDRSEAALIERTRSTSHSRVPRSYELPRSTSQALSRGARAVVIGVTLVASALAVSAAPALPSIVGVPLGFLLGLVAVGELLSLQLFDRSAFSISVAPCLAAGMLFGVPGVVAAAPISAVVRGVYRRTRWYKVVFNASAYVVAGAGAAALFQALAGPLEPTNLARVVAVAALAGLVYYGHTLLVAAVMAFDTKSHVLSVWLEHFRWLWPQYLVLSVMGLFLALGYTQYGVVGAAVFALPPIMLRVVSKQYVDRTLANVRQLRQLNDQLTHQAFHDPLTNLANRAYLTDRVRRALQDGARHGHTTAVLFIDLDNFKIVNDTLGHAAGDALLVAVTDRLKTCLRVVDVASRMGGDEFGILLHDISSTDEYVQVAERLLSLLQLPFVLSGREVFVNASIGIAVAEAGRTDADELLRNADVAMYAAKDAGRGRYEIFDARLHSTVLDRLALETDLRLSIEREELMVHYQPTVYLDDGRTSGLEALVRWRHPQRGIVPPTEFIGLAEESGLIVPIGRWVLQEACRYTRYLQTTVPGAQRLRIAVNLSARQIQEPHIVQDVADALASAHLDPSSLVLEITESLLMQDMDLSTARLRALKALGVQLAIDDFGTGYSSLSYLRRFPVDILKLDRSFVSGVGGASQDAVLTEAIVNLARTLGLCVVAEGIEQYEQLAFLRHLRCDLGQGYYFSPPLDDAETERFVARQSHPAFPRLEAA